MIEYTGIKCPVCEIPFKKDDDIVVCPECGAPYHRNCYHEAGSCIFTELHESGKVWKAPEPPQPPDLKSEIKDQECPSCGTLNAHSALFCNRCGASLSGQPERQYQNRTSYTSSTPPPSAPTPPPSPFGTPFSPFAYDPMGGVSPTEQLDDRVSFGDASKLVKQNTAYYMPVFRYIKGTGKNKFNFCAFLCAGPWMLYRKQYKFGIMATAIQFILYLSYMFLSIFVSSPILRDMMLQIGADTTGELTSTQMQDLYALLTQDAVAYFKVILPMFCLLGIFIVMLVTGIRGNKMYMKHCIRTIQNIKSEVATGDINMQIEAQAGVNMGIAICMFVCYVIITNITLFL